MRQEKARANEAEQEEGQTPFVEKKKRRPGDQRETLIKKDDRKRDLLLGEQADLVLEQRQAKSGGVRFKKGVVLGHEPALVSFQRLLFSENGQHVKAVLGAKAANDHARQQSE